MLRLICSTISIAAVLGVLVVGCGSETPSTPIAGSTAPGSGAGGTKATGAAGINVPGQGGKTTPGAGGSTTPGAGGATGNTETPPAAACLNGVLDDGEECDGTVFKDGDSCATLADGTEGELSCTDLCVVDLAACLPAVDTDGSTDDVYTDV